MKKNYIARCGLNCGQCDAYIATINNDDLGIGQIIEDAYQY